MPQSRKRRAAGRSRTSRGHAPQHGGSRGRGGSNRRNRIIAAVVIVGLLAAGAAYLFAPARRGGAGGSGREVTTPSGLRYEEIVEGTGPSPQPGQGATVHYTGTLVNGTKVDSSRDKGQPYTFTLGAGEVIQGWDEGVATMKVGGRRKLIVPPSLGYGERGRPPLIPGGATLVFDVELVGVK